MPTLGIDIQARLANFEASIKKMETTVTKAAGAMSAALGGVGVALSAAGVVGFVRQAIDAADTLDDLSQKTGATVESLSALGYAAKIEGVSIEALGDGLRKLSVNLQEGAGGSKELRAAFAAVGISAKELGSIGADQALIRIAESFATMEDGAGKAALAVKLFGRAGSEYIPLLNKGAAGLKESADEARRFGLIVSTDAARAAGEFNDNLTKLQSSLGGLGRIAAEAVVGPLSRLTTALLDASQAAGSFGEGLTRLVLGQGSDPSRELEKVEARIRAVRIEREKLKGSLGDSAIARAIPGLSRVASLEDEERSLMVTRDYLKRLQEIQQARNKLEAQSNAPKRAAPVLSSGSSSSTKKPSDALTDEERFARQLDDQRLRDLERDLDEAARRRAELEDEKVRLLQEGPALARQQATQLEAFLATTTAGQVRALQERTRQLVQALNVGAITDGEYDSELQKVREQMARLQLEGGDAFENLANDGEAAFNRLRASIEGWGDATADAIVQMVKTGKFEFGQLVDQLLSDLLRLTVQQTITRPVFTAIGNALGGLNMFGGGSTPTPAGTPFGYAYGGKRATGGPVSAGTAYLVGERGPELFIPKAGGQIVPNSGFGGAAPVVVNVYGGTDPALLRAAAYQGAALANSQMGRAARIGAMS